jgi:hypothetical protein
VIIFVNVRNVPAGNEECLYGNNSISLTIIWNGEERRRKSMAFFLSPPSFYLLPPSFPSVVLHSSLVGN